MLFDRPQRTFCRYSRWSWLLSRWKFAYFISLLSNKGEKVKIARALLDVCPWEKTQRVEKKKLWTKSRTENSYNYSLEFLERDLLANANFKLHGNSFSSRLIFVHAVSFALGHVYRLNAVRCLRALRPHFARNETKTTKIKSTRRHKREAIASRKKLEEQRNENYIKAVQLIATLRKVISQFLFD